MNPVEVLWNDSKDKLSGLDGFIIVGGFSYEDRSRAGIIAALDPIMDQIKVEAEKGKPILGICNGAQVLVESGLVPGLENYSTGMALADNKRISNGQVVGVGYYNTWTHLKRKSPADRCAFTRHLNPSDLLHIPLAHGEGRFIVPEELLNELERNEQISLQYADQSGRVIDEFPVNPNGSINNIAAICNSAGNVMAMMPHPERTKNGDAIFKSMREYIEKGNPVISQKISYSPELKSPLKFELDANSVEWIVDLVISDNDAKSVNNALIRLGYDVNVTRQVHWEINLDNVLEETLEKISLSGEIFNSNKEYIVDKRNDYDASFLVRPVDDIHGRAKYESLTERFNIEEISYIKRGVIWNVNVNSGNLDNVINSILTTNIFLNPHCYEYFRIN
tara:strand:- start:3249 stop:4424 length:1176 start_codon:yes stop_codon:yes gene_type:complete